MVVQSTKPISRTTFLSAEIYRDTVTDMFKTISAFAIVAGKYIYEVIRKTAVKLRVVSFGSAPSLATLTRYRLSLITMKKLCWKRASTLVDEAISSPAAQQ